MLVVLVGIDGAGKSTAARLLVERTRRRGGRALLLHNHGGRRSMSTACAALHVRLPARVADALETTIRIGHVLVAHLRAHRFDGLVLMDRHLHCQLALRSVRGLPAGRLLPWLLGHLPQPDVVVLFDVSPQRAQERITRRGTDHESLAYLQAFREAYRTLDTPVALVPLDAEGEADQITDQLERLLAAIATEPDGSGSRVLQPPAG